MGQSDEFRNLGYEIDHDELIIRYRSSARIPICGGDHQNQHLITKHLEAERKRMETIAKLTEQDAGLVLHVQNLKRHFRDEVFFVDGVAVRGVSYTDLEKFYQSDEFRNL